MKEHYVSYSQADKLKDLEFDWKCTHFYYIITKKNCDWSAYSADNYNTRKEKISSPRLDQAQAWLREVKGIDIEINAYQHLEGESIKHQYNFRVLTINGETFANTWYNNYEEALSDAIDTALELLTDKQNNK